ncbi:MAG TPA: helix-turn-helix transcriptional regulator [Chloroflexota bacterium]|nr:helix-turn-helix transcriptional regulator [Chloroflexota bacterium]
MPVLNRLRIVREARALSQVELARRSRIAQSTLSRLENGRQEAQPSTLRQLARTLRVKPTDLYVQVAMS